jgi:uncharacterized protein
VTGKGVASKGVASKGVTGSAKYLVIGSFEAYSGKSAITLGIANQFKQKGFDIAYGKPLGGGSSQAKSDGPDEDVSFIGQTLGLEGDRIQPTVLTLNSSTLERHLRTPDVTPYTSQLQAQKASQAGDLVLLEGAGTIDEGRLFQMSVPQIAEQVDGKILVVARYHSMLLLDHLLTAKQQMGDRFLGVVINDVPQAQFELVNGDLRQFLEDHEIPVFGVLPSSTLLHSVSVEELQKKLQAEVLCRADRLDLMVESLTIGAMNVNSALKYFRQRHNMAVVTGGDRTDLQLAALETSTQCLILTGHIPPTKAILARAEEMEIPILSVDLDTLTTVEIIDRAFGQVRLHEPIKVACIFELVAEHVDGDRLLAALGM